MSEYRSKVLNTIHYVEVPFATNHCEVEKFASQAKDWLNLPVDIHVFDLKNVKLIDDSFYMTFQKFKDAAEIKKHQVVSINIGPALLAELKARGKEKTFAQVKNLNLAQKPKAKDYQVDVNLWVVKYSVVAARAAMNIMFNTTVAADENYRENYKNLDPEKFYRVAHMHIKGPTVSAEFRLLFDKKTLEALTRIYLPSGTLLDEEITDSTALELLNLIYSGAKSKLNEDRGYNLPTAIPTLEQISKSSEKMKRDINNLFLIPMATPVGTYYLEIDFSPSQHI